MTHEMHIVGYNNTMLSDPIKKINIGIILAKSQRSTSNTSLHVFQHH